MSQDRKCPQDLALHLLLIAVAGYAVYAAVLHAPFVFDDRTSITDNPVIKDLHRFFADWSGYQQHPRRFLGYLTFALNYRFGALSTAGYHFVNLAIHIATAFLVYFLGLLTFRTPRMRDSVLASYAAPVSLLAALIFVLHPVQTEAVTYITQRLASLATMLYLPALVLWVRGRLLREEFPGRKVSLAYAAGAALAAFAAMFTKEIAVTIPLAAGLFALLFFKGGVRARLAGVLPLVPAVLLPIMIWHYTAPAHSPAELLEQPRHISSVSRADYLATQPRVLLTYVRLFLFPVNQNLDYDYPVYHSAAALPVAASLGLLLLTAWPAVLVARRSAKGKADPAALLISFGILWFFVTISVESSIIPLDDLIAEHRLYLPSVGLAIAAATAAGFLARRFGNGRIALLVGAVLLALGVAAWQRNQVWTSPLSLWRDTVAKSPGKARPRYNLGTVLDARGASEEAIRELREALRIRPDYVEAWHNLGVAYAGMRKYDEAAASYRQALRLYPRLPESHNALGTALMGMGKADEATAAYKEAVRLDPGYADARNNLGAAYGMQGRADAAIAELEAAVRLQPDNPRFHLNLAKAYELKGWAEKAEAERSRADQQRK